jgi:NADH:ubiquinone oxidoreductase subunit 6 (subunit J)
MPPSFIPFAVDFWPVVGAVVPAALGFAAVYLLLPRPQGRSVTAGAALGVLALVAVGALLSYAVPNLEGVLFYVFSGVAIVAGVLLITQSNPARAALSFALVVLSTCGLFLLQAAPFLMAATIIIYAGAIIVTFLFVIMLAQQEGRSDADYRSREPLLSALAGFVLAGALFYVLGKTYRPPILGDLDTQLHDLAREEMAVADRSRRAAAGEQLSQEDARGTVDQLSVFLSQLQRWLDRHTPQVREQDEEGSLLPENSRKLSAAVEEALAQASKQSNNVNNQRPVKWDELEKSLAAVHAAGLQVRNSFGILQPPEERPLPNDGQPPEKAAVLLSSGSGPPANVPLADLRRDARGQPEQPAENVAYLGRSLFTDYLLPVELGGTLLLVATIGAIAIAGRRAERAP